MSDPIVNAYDGVGGDIRPLKTAKAVSTMTFDGQRASIGRVVWFCEEGGPYTADVVGVNEDDTLELCTKGPNSVYFQHRVPYGSWPTRGAWCWPPRF